MDNSKLIFISYAREDFNMAHRLHSELKRIGGNPWLDQENLLPGQDWEREISLAIEKSAFFIAVLSSNSVSKTGYVQKELKKALQILELQPPGKVYLIPARLDDVNPLHEEILKLHRVDLFSSWDAGLRKIKMSIGLPEPTSAPEPPIAANQTHKHLYAMTNELLSTIKADAAAAHPKDFATQKYVINNQVEALRSLANYRPSDVPAEVLIDILNEAYIRHPNDFSTQLYVIQNQVKAWREISNHSHQN